MEKHLDFKVDQLPLEEALSQLSAAANVPFSYSNTILPSNRIISINLIDQELGEILKQLLRRTSVRYKQVGTQIVLFYQKRKREKFKISGFIEDRESGEKMVGANIYERTSGSGASTNEYGYFSFTVLEGEIELACSYLGYDTKIQKLLLSKDLEVNIFLKPNLTLREVVVISSEYRSALDALPPISSDDIPVQQMSRQPTLAGEADIFRMAEFMPGVQTGADGIGGLHIRGGSTDQNLVLMDGVPIYNAAHSLGVFSVFNPEAVKSMQLFKGAFPARYTGRLSSVMDIRTKEGNMKKWSGHARAGMAASSASIEGPIVKDKVSVFFTARRSILDRVIQKATQKIKFNNEIFREQFGVPLEGNSNYNFFDLNGKLNFSFSRKSKLYLSYYKGNDNFFDNDRLTSVQEDDYTYSDELTRNYNWGNKVAVLRWNYLFGNKLFLNTTFTRSVFNYDTDLSYELRYKPRVNTNTIRLFSQRIYFSSLKDWAAKIDFDYSSSNNHHLRFGASSTLHQFRPGVFSANNRFNGEKVLDSLYTDPDHKLWEHVVYLEDEFYIGEKLKIALGVNAMAVQTEKSNFDFANGDTTYFSIQPRLLVSYEAVKDLIVQGAFSKITQPLHLLTGTDIGLPNDIWVPSTPLVRPQSSWQTSLGLNYQLKKQYNFSLEFYYKKLQHLISYQAGSSLSADIANPSSFVLSDLNSTNWELQVISGEGESYGGEFMVQKSLGTTTGSVSYTYAHAIRNFAKINNGADQRFRFDRRHDLKIAMNHKIFDWMDISWNWIYGTGLSTLIPVREYIIETPTGPETLFDFEDRELLANHRLDAGVNFYLNKKGLQHHWYAGVYNAYNRRNPQYYTLRSVLVEDSDPLDPEFERVLIQGNFLPVLPSVSYSLRF